MRKGSIRIREPQLAAVGASRTGPPLGRILLVCFFAGLFLAVLSPFGTHAAPWAVRYAYWIGIVLLGGLLGWGMAILVLMIRPLWGRPWLQTLAVALLMTPVGAMMVWGVTGLAFGDNAPFKSPLDYLPSVLIISLAVSAVNRLAVKSPPPEVDPAPPPSGPPKFLSRLPDRLRGAELYALEAEDHYLRAHTSKGSDLILCRLSDAVAELEGVEGARVHRSWWVARAAVTAAVKGDGRGTLTLKSGVEAPVSRTAFPALRSAGWL